MLFRSEARVLRSIHGDGVKQVFIGPCIAKKGESLGEPIRQWVDHVITFEELAALLVARQIDPAQLRDGAHPEVQDGSGAGRG